MRCRFVGAVLVVGTALALAGCSSLGTSTSFDPGELDHSEGWRVIRGIPVRLQKGEQECGLAALGMVLEYWLIPDALEKVIEDCPVLPARGIKASDLKECARKAGLDAYLIHGRWEDLENELARKHPVLVGLVKPHLTGTVSHYEVVVGVHPQKKIVLTLDPGHGWRQNTVLGFSREWEPTGCLTLVIFKEDLPTSPGEDSGWPSGTESPCSGGE